jgi:hypothetical protein
MRLILADAPTVVTPTPDIWIAYIEASTFLIAPWITKGYDRIDKYVIGAGGGGGGGNTGIFTGQPTTAYHGGGGGGGGGAGGLKWELGKALSSLAASNAVVIGAGGALGVGAHGTANANAAGSAGGNSSFDGLTGYGGGGGGKGSAASTTIRGYGGSGGGGGAYAAAGAVGLTGVSTGAAGGASGGGGGTDGGIGGSTSTFHPAAALASTLYLATSYGGPGGGGGASGSINVPIADYNNGLYNGGLSGNGDMSVPIDYTTPEAAFGFGVGRVLVGGGPGGSSPGPNIPSITGSYLLGIVSGDDRYTNRLPGSGGTGGSGGADNQTSNPDASGKSGRIGAYGAVLIRIWKA